MDFYGSIYDVLCYFLLFHPIIRLLIYKSSRSLRALRVFAVNRIA